MMKTLLYTALLAVAATTACRRSEMQHNQQAGALQIEIERQAFDNPDSLDQNPASKATETAFVANDSIGVYVHTTPTTTATGNHTPNLLYATTNGTTWTANGHLSDVPQTGKTYTATGYYPYHRELIDPTALLFSVAGDQTTAKAVALSDLMTTAPTAIVTPTTAPKLTLQFKHLFTKITIKFAVPPAIDGAEVTKVERVALRGVFRAATVNLANSTLTNPTNQGDISMRLVSGDPAVAGSEVVYEAIAVPQTVKKEALLAELTFATASGARTFAYRPTADEVWTTNLKRNLHLVSVGDLCFASRLDLTDGLAHTAMVLKVKAPKNAVWSLTSPQAWLTLSATAGGTYAASISGTGTGAEQTVYVKVVANTAVSGVVWQARSAVLALATGTVSTTYTATQNYYRFGLAGAVWTVDAGQSTRAVAPFASNQEWKATGSGDWLKISPSAEFGAGEPVPEYEGSGSVGGNGLFIHIAPNNTAAAREGTVIFTPATAGGSVSVTTVKQPVAACVLSPKAVGVSKSAAPAVRLFTVAVPLGVRWKVLSAVVGGASDMGLLVQPAVGAEQVGTGEPQQVVGSYAELTGDAGRWVDVVVAWAAYGVAQQATVRVSQHPESVVVGNVRWATGNLVASNAVAGMRGEGGCRVGAPTDGGVYFQFGSLIGYKGGDQANGGTGAGTPDVAWDNKCWNGVSAYSWANDAMVWPTGMSGSPATWPQNATTNQWYFGLQTNWSTAGQNIRDFPNLATGGLANKGVGDPCTYYLGGTWRLPSTAEYASITGKTGGSWILWKTLGVTGRWATADQTFNGVTGPGAWFGSGLDKGEGTPTAGNLFFLTSGQRFTSNGLFNHVITGGHYWSSSVYATTLCYNLTFNELSGVIPQNNNYRSSALPVRCVQSIVVPTVPNTPTADDYVTINNLKWAKGNLIAVNQSNAKIGKPEDGGIYFQFGSLIGYKGGNQLNDGKGVGMPQAPLTTNGTYWNGSGFSWASDAAVWPTELVGTKTSWTNTTGSNIATLTDYYFNYSVAPWETTSQNIRDFNLLPGTGVGTLGTGRYAALGVGDPCTYYLGGTWRLPTGAEYAALCNNQTAINKNYTWAEAGASWVTSPVVGGNFSTNRLFSPVSGVRDYSTGSFYTVATHSYYWSSSVYNATHGLHLNFTSSWVYPQYNTNRANGFPVRCVSN